MQFRRADVPFLTYVCSVYKLRDVAATNETRGTRHDTVSMDAGLHAFGPVPHDMMPLLVRKNNP